MKKNAPKGKNHQSRGPCNGDYKRRILKKTHQQKNNGLIKVITGIRRCGKSYMLDPIFKNHLLNEGIPADYIDSFQKIIIVKDHIKPWRTEDGILVVGIIDFLLDADSLLR